MKESLREHFLGHASMSLWAIIVGTSFPLVSALSPELPMLLVTAFRFIVAVVVLLPFMPSLGRTKPTLRSIALYIVMGACQALFFSAMFWAAPRTSSLVMSSLYVLVPVMAYFLGLFLQLASPENGLLKILLTGAGGALLLAWAGFENHTGESLAGPAIYFLGCMAAALHPTLSKWGIERKFLSQSAAARSVYSLLAGALLTSVAGISIEPVTMLKQIGLIDLAILLYLGIMSTALTFWLTQYATQSLLPAEVKGYSYLIPLVTLGLTWLLGNADLQWAMLPGGLLVLLSIVLLQRRSVSLMRAPATVTLRNDPITSPHPGGKKLLPTNFDLLSIWQRIF